MRLLSIVCLFALLVCLPADARPHIFGRPHFPRLAAHRAERTNAIPDAAMLPAAIPQQLPVGPEKAADPLDPKNAAPLPKTPAVSESKVFLKHGKNPPAAPAGFFWKKNFCVPEGCEWQLEPTRRGSAFSECQGCPCGCQEGGVCLCGSRK